jgi:hypothetical protein
LFQNAVITAEDIRNYPTEKWNWDLMKQNPNLGKNSTVKTVNTCHYEPITAEKLDNVFDDYCQMISLSSHPNISLAVLKHCDFYHWDRMRLCHNTFPCAREEYIKNGLRKHFHHDIHKGVIDAYLHPNNIQKWLDAGYEMMTLCIEM